MRVSYLNTSLLRFNPQAEDPSFGSDAVILDLEDAVHMRHKEQARSVLATLDLEPLLARGIRFGVRINSLMSLAGLQDWCTLTDLLRQQPGKITFIQLPKVESAFEVELCRSILNENSLAIEIIPIIETPKGVEHLERIAALSDAMMFGRVDMTAAMYRSNAGYMAYARGRFCVACAQCGIPAVDTANFGSGSDIMDLDAFEQDCMMGLAEGFTARAVVHPAQVEIVNRVFTVSEEELQTFCDTIIAYADAETGFSVVNGNIVAPPFVARARRMLRLYRSAS